MLGTIELVEFEEKSIDFITILIILDESIECTSN